LAVRAGREFELVAKHRRHAPQSRRANPTAPIVAKAFEIPALDAGVHLTDADDVALRPAVAPGGGSAVEPVWRRASGRLTARGVRHVAGS
jgi:hypothetical protein